MFFGPADFIATKTSDEPKTFPEQIRQHSGRGIRL
jgi:hypothetical protein